MNREQAERMLRRGRGGIREWNKQREQDTDLPDLSGVQLDHADLKEANLDGVNLTGANLESANLSAASLVGTILEEANLKRADLSGADLSEARLAGSDLSEAKLPSAKLVDADLKHVRLTNAKLEKANLKGADLRDAKLDGAGLSYCDFENAKLGSADLSGCLMSEAKLRHADLSNADLSNIRMAKVELTEANFSGAKLCGADLREAHASATTVFDDADMTNAKLTKSELTKPRFLRTRLASAQLSEAILDEADFTGAWLESAQLHGTKLRNVIAQGAHCWAAKFSGADLSNGDLSRADVRGCDFAQATLNGTNLLAARANSGTRFLGAKVVGCKIDRHTLESLDKFGGLTTGDRMEMVIRDGVAQLRASYSGFLQWIHLSALVVFLFPYGSFVLKHWSVARFGLGASDSTIPLWMALLRYIYNGGENWQSGWHLSLLPFTAFIFSLIYNMVRGVLLWKTKTLEIQQEASGLPAVFSLTGGWGFWYRAAKFGFYMNLGVVALHTVHFLRQRIPIYYSEH